MMEISLPLLSAYAENDRLSGNRNRHTPLSSFKRSKKEEINVANFMRYAFSYAMYLSAVSSGADSQADIQKQPFSRMQYNLWFLLLLGLLVVPFIPFRLIGFPQIFSWLGNLRSSPASGTATAIGKRKN